MFSKKVFNEKKGFSFRMISFWYAILCFLGVNLLWRIKWKHKKEKKLKSCFICSPLWIKILSVQKRGRQHFQLIWAFQRAWLSCGQFYIVAAAFDTHETDSSFAFGRKHRLQNYQRIFSLLIKYLMRSRRNEKAC